MPGTKVLFCRAHAIYTGRIDAQLTLGDYLILLRDPLLGGDGSALIYAHKGLGPRNWMPAGSSHVWDGDGKLTVEHAARGEVLTVYIDEVFWSKEAPVGLEGELVKTGRESEFADLLAADLSVLEPGLTLVSREFPTVAGPVDIMCTDETGKSVVVEIKRRKITLSAIWQLKKYQHAVGSGTRGILVAPVLAKKAKELLQDEPTIIFRRCSYEQLAAGDGGRPTGETGRAPAAHLE